MRRDPDCAFCAIAQGESPDTIMVWEADDWVAFFPLGPATPGHTLIVPRDHVVDLWEVSPPLDTELIAASIQLGHAVRAALKPQGMNLITSSGHAAEQTVFHLHLHIVPRWHDDAFGRIWPEHGHGEDTAAELNRRAAEIRDYIK